jgi:hypothetical protein
MGMRPVDFISGYEACANGGILVGFREWLIVKNNDYNNLAWEKIALYDSFPGSSDPLKEIEDNIKNQYAIHHLIVLIHEYFDYKNKVGLKKIFLDYQKWLQNQDWYDESSPEWYDWGSK